jgi:hypothetical protein
VWQLAKRPEGMFNESADFVGLVSLVADGSSALFSQLLINAGKPTYRELTEGIEYVVVLPQ